jgi:putative ABC transport system permease protein
MQEIPLPNLALSFLPVIVVVAILYRWSLGGGMAIYAMARMLIQLLLIGYVLNYIFQTEHSLVIVGVLTVMLIAASWIALRTTNQKRGANFLKVLSAIVLGGVTTLVLVTQGVLDLDPWFEPKKMIPLAGMIFAGAMNAVSLAAERFNAEMEQKGDYVQARRTALGAAMIPITNSLFAVGLVSLPGMMTGQILSGVSPLIAARYQIMVMCMLFGSSGIAAACYLTWIRPREVITD